MNCEIVPFRSVLFPYYAKSRLIFSLFLVRNMNRFPFWPIRSDLYKTGPGEACFIISPMIAMMGNSEKIDGLYIGLCDGTDFCVDDKAANKYDENGNEIVIDENADDSQFLQPVDDETRAALERHVDGFCDAYLKLSASTGDPTTPYGELLNYIEAGSELDKTLKQVFLIGDWSHNAYYQYGGSTLISAYSIGGGCYVVDYSA